MVWDTNPQALCSSSSTTTPPRPVSSRLFSDPDDPRAEADFDELTGNLIPNELAAPLPGNPLDPNSLRFQQLKSEAEHLAFREFIEHQPPPTWQPGGGGLRKVLGLGGQF